MRNKFTLTKKRNIHKITQLKITQLNTGNIRSGSRTARLTCNRQPRTSRVPEGDVCRVLYVTVLVDVSQETSASDGFHSYLLSHPHSVIRTCCETYARRQRSSIAIHLYPPVVRIIPYLQRTIKEIARYRTSGRRRPSHVEYEPVSQSRSTAASAEIHVRVQFEIFREVEHVCQVPVQRVVLICNPGQR